MGVVGQVASGAHVIQLVKNECLSRRQPKFSQAKRWPFVQPDDLFNVAEEFS
jgi:hypothetical protein